MLLCNLVANNFPPKLLYENYSDDAMQYYESCFS